MTTSEEPHTRPRAGTAPTMLIALLALTGLGALLRLAAARGPLWLDEIWTFRILAQVHSVAAVFVALPYDTNHPLTSAWLTLVGPQASTLVVRAQAILLGTLTVPAAMIFGARYGRADALALGAIFAVDQVFVQFGSEARGYAGLILAALVAGAAMERFLGTRRLGALIVFMAAIAFGTFSHVLMVEATGVLCAAGVLRTWTGGPATSRGGTSLALVAAAALATLPALVCIAISLKSAPMHTGFATPFSWPSFGEGLGRLLRAEAGLPDGPLDAPAKILILAGALLAAATGFLIVLPERRALPALALALPVVSAAVRLPNEQYPRFHLVAGIGLALLSAAAWARAWRRGGRWRAGAALVAVAFLIGQGVALGRFLLVGRGDPAAAVALMSEDGPTRVLVEPPIQAGETTAVIHWFADAAHREVRAVDSSAACASPPDWLVLVTLPFEPAPAVADRIVTRDGCTLRFAWRASLPAYGFSGFRWTLYRHLP